MSTHSFPTKRRLSLRVMPLAALKRLEAAYTQPGETVDSEDVPILMSAFLLHSRVLHVAGRPMPRAAETWVSNAFSRIEAGAQFSYEDLMLLRWHLLAMFAAADEIKDEAPWKSAYLDVSIKAHFDRFEWRGGFAHARREAA